MRILPRRRPFVKLMVMMMIRMMMVVVAMIGRRPIKLVMGGHAFDANGDNRYMYAYPHPHPSFLPSFHPSISIARTRPGGPGRSPPPTKISREISLLIR